MANMGRPGRSCSYSTMELVSVAPEVLADVVSSVPDLSPRFDYYSLLSRSTRLRLWLRRFRRSKSGLNCSVSFELSLNRGFSPFRLVQLTMMVQSL